MPDSAPPGNDVAGRPRARGQIGGLIKACHPGPSVVVAALTAAMAFAVGLTGGRLLLVTAAVLTGQLSIGWLNDLHDQAADATAGRADKPLATGAVSPAMVRSAWVTATVATVILSAVLGARAGGLNLLTVVCGWTYDLRLKATAWSWLPFAVAFGVLPGVVVAALPPPVPSPPWWAVAAGALLGVGAHLANALPDIQADRAMGVGGLPARIGPGATRVLAGSVLAAAGVMLAFAPAGPPGLLGWIGVLLSAVLVAAGLVRRWPAESRTPFVFVATLAVVDVLLLVIRVGNWAPSG